MDGATAQQIQKYNERLEKWRARGPFRAYRAKKKITRTELAYNLGISAETLGHWERGDKIVQQKIRVRIPGTKIRRYKQRNFESMVTPIIGITYQLYLKWFSNKPRHPALPHSPGIRGKH